MADITYLLERVQDGNEQAQSELLDALYAELRRLAGHHMRGQPAGHTLQATALVNEAWLRLIRPAGKPHADRTHFLAFASRAMRSVLVDHARRRAANKRKAVGEQVPLDRVTLCFENKVIDLIGLDAALKELAQFDREMAEVVELRFFGGLPMDEIGAALEIPKRTLERRWTATRAWLRTRVE